jgi:ABC-type phosphate/phosphonate transport system substrate-binding protein
MKKSIIIFLSVLAVSITFSGCGESEGSASSSSGDSGEVSVSAEETTGGLTSGIEVVPGNVATAEEIAEKLVASKLSIEELFGPVPDFQ